MNKNTFKSQSNSIIEIEDLKTLVRVAAKNWYIFLIFIIIAFASSFLYSYKLTNIYGAQTQLIMETNDNINEQSIINENFGSYYNWWNQSNSEYVTAIRVLKSYDHISNTIKRLKLGVSYFIVGRIKTTEVYGSIPYEVEVFAINPKFYEKEISFKVLDESSYQFIININGQEITKKGIFDKEYIDEDVKLIVKNKAITKENVSTISLHNYKIVIHDTPNLVYKFQSNLSVENLDGTNILQIKLEDEIPERAQTFLDTMTSVYIESTLQTRLNINTNTLNYIEKQMVEVTNVLNSIEDTMQAFKENKNILDLGKEEADYFKKMSSYDGELSSMTVQMDILNELERYIIEDKDPQFLPPNAYILSNDEFLKKTASELYNLQLKENENLGTATKDNYAIIEGQERINKLRKELLVYIDNSKKAIIANMENIRKQVSFYVSNIKTIPKKQREMLGIQRNLDVNQRMYLFLLEKKSNTIIGRAGILPQIKIIEAARNIGVIRPDKKKIQMFFLIIAAILALVVIFIRTTFFAHIESLDELKKLTTFPLIGEIIQSPASEGWTIAVEKESKSPLTESFRTIRTNLQYMSPDSGSKVIVVTSNNPGEGKTFTSLNIAAILAKAGKKVLLLELDLHRPKIQKALNMQADGGITTVLIGKMSINEAIKKTRIENLHTMLSGPIPPSPSEILLSKSMEDIMIYARENYDYTIIDTPPVGLISDALVLMKNADITLFILNTRSATVHMLKDIHDMVEVHEIKSFGFILNGVKAKRSKYYYNRYSQGYDGYYIQDEEIS